jgi:hypothetical protein
MNARSFSKLAGLVLVVSMAVPSGARADMVTLNLGTVTHGSFVNGDQSSSPYSVATITDGTDVINGNTVSGVYLTMANPGLGFAGSGDYEHVSMGGAMNPVPSYLFELSSTAGLSSSSFTLISQSGIDGSTFSTFAVSVGGNYSVTGSPTFNLGFTFLEGSGSTDGNGGGGPPNGPGRTGSYAGTVEFGALDSVEYFVKGVSSSQFVSSNGDYTVAAVDDANMAVIGAISKTTNASSTPEPSSIVGLASIVFATAGCFACRRIWAGKGA